jgi:hypothetical protein
MNPFPVSSSRPKALFLLLTLAAPGCHSMGPDTISRDRPDYSTSILESWKRQTLLNIVRLRYLDPPIFVDVGQIVAGYTLETDFTAAGQVSSGYAVQGNSATLAGAEKYTDRPTITYTPLTGNKFVKGLMTPLPPNEVFFTIQSGWPADAVLFSTLSSINGLKNQRTNIAGITAPDPDFLRVLALMRKIQLSGGVGIRIVQDAKSGESTILTFQSGDVSPETLADRQELRRLLKLDPNADEFKLVFGTTARNNQEVAVVTRSILQLMSTLSSQADVPPEDVTQGRTIAGWESVSGTSNAMRLIQIRSSSSKPADAFVAVNYRDHWFWIDDRDLKSKRTFSFMMMLFTLADTGDREPPPLITIPAQ